jgi:hypothetical protein
MLLVLIPLKSIFVNFNLNKTTSVWHVNTVCILIRQF